MMNVFRRGRTLCARPQRPAMDKEKGRTLCAPAGELEGRKTPAS